MQIGEFAYLLLRLNCKKNMFIIQAMFNGYLYTLFCGAKF